MDSVTVLTQRVKVDRTNFNRAVFRPCGEWASLPCAPGHGFGDSEGYYDRSEYGDQNARSIEFYWLSFQAELAVEQKILSSQGDN